MNYSIYFYFLNTKKKTITQFIISHILNITLVTSKLNTYIPKPKKPKID